MRKHTVAGVLCVMGTLLVAAAPALAQTATADVPDVQITGEYGYGLPPAVYEHDYGARVDSLIGLLHWFMLALFVAWGAFFVYCLFKFRARPGHRANSKPIKAKISKYAEVGVALFEAFLLIGLSYPVWAEVKQDFPTDEENPLRVRVVAEQFAWNFHYPGKDGVFGRTSPEKIDLAANPLGLDFDDPHAEDDFVSGEFHIPVHRPVIADIRSKDVIHSFFIPVLRIKQDAIPGMGIPVWFQAKERGNYEVACAQLCGNNHYSMRAVMVVDSEDDFEAWYEEQSAPPEFFEDF